MSEEVIPKDEQELDSLESWKYLMLHGLGFAPDDILYLLAHNPRLDWHDADGLLAEGYTHRQVVYKLESPRN